jgi:hypothetical protein
VSGEDQNWRLGVRAFQRMENARVRVTLYDDGELVVTPLSGPEADEDLEVGAMSITEQKP